MLTHLPRHRNALLNVKVDQHLEFIFHVHDVMGGPARPLAYVADVEVSSLFEELTIVQHCCMSSLLRVNRRKHAGPLPYIQVDREYFGHIQVCKWAQGRHDVCLGVFQR